MTFLTAGLLVAGAVSVLVPILIHLLARQRRRPVAWAAMRFLMEALRRHRRRLQLEQLLLLAVRCLILLLLGAALARPFLESAGVLDVGGARSVFLVIDNGLASGARRLDGSGRTVLGDSVERAIKLVKALKPGDTVGVVTAARPARGLVVPPSSDHRAIIDLLRAIEPAETPTDLPAALPLVGAALDELGPDRDRAVVYLLSDFRSGSAPLEQALPSLGADGGPAPTLLASEAGQGPVPNVQVVSIEPLRGLILSSGEAGTGQVTVRLARTGGQLDRDVTRVRLTGEALPPVEPKVVEWAPGQAEGQVDFVVNLAGLGDGAVAVTAVIDDDALDADNRRHTVLASRGRVRVLLIDRRSFGADPDLDRLRAGQWMQRALHPSPASPVEVVERDPAALDRVDVRGADAAVLARPDLLVDTGWAALRSFVDRGGLLLVTPPGDSVVHPWTDRLAGELGLPWRIGLEVVEHPDEGLALAGEQPASEILRLLSGDLDELVQPVTVTRTLPVDEAQTEAETVLRFEDGSPLLIAGAPRSRAAGAGGSAPAGLVLYLAVSPQYDWTNLPMQPLMVPLMHELIKQGVGIIRTAQRYSAGERPALGRGAAASALADPSGRTISLDADGRPSEPLLRSGVYDVLDPARQPVGRLAVNVDPAAGRTDPQPQAAVAEWLERCGPWSVFDPDDAARTLRAADSGAPLSGALLIAVLFLVVLETALARWFSHALRGRGDRSPDLASMAGERAVLEGAA